MDREVTRMVVVRCVDWPVLAVGAALGESLAVMANHRVLACSPAARQAGVRVGHRKREAQRRCPDVQLVPFDVQQCSRRFEPVLAALDEITPRVEIYESGLVGFPTRGPSRFYGGDRQLGELVSERVGNALADMREEYRLSVRVGIADGAFAAQLAASMDATASVNSATSVRIVQPGASAEFLSPKPITCIDNKPLVDLLVRLGLSTLGSWAQISEGDVVGRFGHEGVAAHRLANGLDRYPPNLRRPASELVASTRFEPVAESVSQCEHAVFPLAARLLDLMGSKGLTCTRLGIEVETENGETLTRWWRYHGASLSAGLVVERVRQQLEGWLLQGEPGRPRSGVLRISLIPDEVVAAAGDQISIWDTEEDNLDEVSLLVSRLQSMVGTGTVWVPELAGGIGPNEQIRLVPADSFDLKREACDIGLNARPWPGQIPEPSPARVFSSPGRADLVDCHGTQVGVDGRGELWPDPAVLILSGDSFDVESWAGPWLDDRWWWDVAQRCRRARMQVLTSTNQAFLLMVERQQWWLEAAYD